MMIVKLPGKYSVKGFYTSGFSDTAVSQNGMALEQTVVRNHNEGYDPDGWNPPLPYSRHICEGVLMGLTWAADTKTSSISGTDPTKYLSVRTSGNFAHGVSVTPPAVPSALIASCEQRALARLKDDSVFNAAVAFGERRETAKLVETTCLRLRRAVKAVRKLDVKKAGAALGLSGTPELRRINRKWARKKAREKLTGKAPHQLWLELQYGWKPLLSDVHGACQEVFEKDTYNPDRYNIFCVAKGEETFFRKQTAYVVGNILRQKVLVLDQCLVRAKVRLDFSLANPELVRAVQLGLTNPMLVVWELVPFSFVADWFLPIGDWLSEFDATMGWTFKGGSLSKVAAYQRSCSTDGPFELQTVYGHPHKGYSYVTGGEGRCMYFDRTVYATPPSGRRPQFDNEALTHGTRALNAIALLRSAFLK